MEIVFIARHQDTTLVNDLEELVVVEGFMEVGIGVDLHIGRPNMVLIFQKRTIHSTNSTNQCIFLC